MKRFIVELTPPIIERMARPVGRRLHGLGSHDFWSSIAADHKNAPGPSEIASLVFRPTPQSAAA